MRKILTVKAVIFLLGAVCYSSIELLYRGHTHWTMAVTGGIVLCMLCSIHFSLPGVPIYQKCLLGTLFITSLEFTEGIILNRILSMKVWDYSDSPFNILGQVCPKFSAMWFFLCIPTFLVCKAVSKFI